MLRATAQVLGIANGDAGLHHNPRTGFRVTGASPIRVVRRRNLGLGVKKRLKEAAVAGHLTMQLEAMASAAHILTNQADG